MSTATAASVMTVQDDTALLQRFQDAGDGNALADLFDRHAEALYRVARSLTACPSDAEDAVQQLFTHLLPLAGRLKPVTHPRAWLLKSLARLCLKRRQRQRHEILSPMEFDAMPAPISPALDDDGHDQVRLQGAVRSALDALPDRYRIPLAMRFLDGLAIADIAAALDRTEAVLRKQLSRGLERLREHPRLKNSVASAAVVPHILTQLRDHEPLPRHLMPRLRQLAANQPVGPTASPLRWVVQLSWVAAITAIAAAGFFIWPGGQTADHISAVRIDGNGETASTMTYDPRFGGVFFSPCAAHYDQHGWIIPRHFAQGFDVEQLDGEIVHHLIDGSRTLNAHDGSVQFRFSPDSLPEAFVVTFMSDYVVGASFVHGRLGADNWQPIEVPLATASAMASAEFDYRTRSSNIFVSEIYLRVGQDQGQAIYEYASFQNAERYSWGWRRGPPTGLLFHVTKLTTTISQARIIALPDLAAARFQDGAR